MQKYKLPKELVLDYRRWICGPRVKNKKNLGTGIGDTELLNSDNRLCCLGQWAEQAGVPRKELLGCSCPSDLASMANVVESLVRKDGETYDDSQFSSNAMTINDDDETTIVQKVKKLTSLCKKYKRVLKLKNFPKTILKELGV